MKPHNVTQIIDRVRYSTETATLLAGNDWWDGHNYERGGTNRFLYRTPRARFFFLNLSQWQGARNGIQPCSVDDAVSFYEGVQENCRRVPYQAAFPGVQVEEG